MEDVYTVEPQNADTFGTCSKCPDYLDRCPDFKGKTIHVCIALYWDRIKCPDYKEVS